MASRSKGASVADIFASLQGQEPTGNLPSSCSTTVLPETPGVKSLIQPWSFGRLTLTAMPFA